MANILVTGAAGFLGSHLVDKLLFLGHTIVGVDNMLGGDLGNVHEGCWFEEADCCNLEYITRAMKNIEVVYHCAASPHEGLSVFSPILVTKNTYLSTVVTATAAIQAGVKRFVFTSSMARYGNQPMLPFIEDMVCNPVDPYGIAKLAAEKTLLCLGKQHGMEVVIAVPHNIIGSRQKYDDPYRNVAAIMINLMLQGRQPIIYGDGNQRRCFSFVDDCIEPLVKMGFEEGLDGEIINIGPDDSDITINTLAGVISRFTLTSEAMNGVFEPVYMPARACEVKEAWPSADKARRLLGYEPKTRLANGLLKMMEWIHAKGTKPFIYHLPLEIEKNAPLTWKEKMF